jgi:DNA polymerase-3 subunit gamma/tau
MSYLVLARKYRPNNFLEVAGQEHVTKTLANSIERDKVGHAYLFCGPRGVGKTSIARIFAKSLNCEKGPTAKPCGKCTNCKEITEGRSLAVQEIDGASHNSVDNVRELIETFRSAPPPGSKYKVYIIDEVHMLSISAFNALLKSLEEPPPNTVFILATTEVHKIPETVLSRCQRHNFKAIPLPIVKQQLESVAKSEKLEIEEEVLSMIARLSEGSMRDAQTLLDRVQSYCDGKITTALASEVLSAVDRSVLFRISEAIFAHKVSDALEALNQTFSIGVDTNLLLKEFVSHWRELLIASTGSEKNLNELGISSADQTELHRQVKSQTKPDLQDLTYMAREGADQALRSSYPKYALEALIVRMATRPTIVDFGKLVGDLKSLASNKTSNIRQASSPISNYVPQNTEVVSKSEKLTSKKAIINNGDLLNNWRSFVSFASSRESLMLVEQLKRLSPIVFENGTLKATGTELCLTYLKENSNIEKLKKLLTEYDNSDWKIDLTSSINPASAEAGSLVAVEKQDKMQKIQKQTQNLASHPSVQSLKKIFPGSTIESVKVKT